MEIERDGEEKKEAEEGKSPEQIGKMGMRNKEIE